MFYLIYKITNTINNKIYIGKHQTKDKNDDYMGSGKLLLKAINKYGIDKFKKEILFECNSEEEMNQKEAEIVDDEFVARIDTYNVKLGGQGGWDFCNNNSEMQSNKAKNNWLKYGKEHPILKGSQDFYNNMSEEEYNEYCSKLSMRLKLYYDSHENWWKGRTQKEESKQKISKALKGKYIGDKNSNYGHCWIYNDDLEENKSIDKKNLNQWIEKGWKKGRKMKYRKKPLDNY